MTELTELHDELRAVARDLLTTAKPLDWPKIAEPGWLGLEVPEPFDGADATFAEVAVVLEEMGRAASRTAYLGAVVLGVGTLNLLVASPARDDLLRAVASGAVIPSVALVDGADDGLDGAPPFRLERSADGMVLHGRAAFVPDVAEAGRILLLARDPDGTPVVVDLVPGTVDTVGLQITTQPVLDETRRFGVVAAEGVAVPEDAVLRFAADPEGAVGRLLDRAAAALACDSLGVSEAMLDATVAYARTRQQFGRPIGSFQAVKHACADLFVQVSVSRHLVEAAVRAIAEDDVEAPVAVSMAKSYSCTAAVTVAGKAMQLHGGMGYAWESGIHAYLKRAALSRSLFGSPTAHRRRLAHRYL